jgi:glycosyltransferase involved in cell wall biosynthesis
MGIGLPIIATGGGSIPKVMDGKGELLEGFGPDSFGHRLQQTLLNPTLTEHQGKKIRVLAASFFLRYSIDRYEDLVLTCLAEKGC